VRGYRVDLAEIEAALRNVTGITEAAVVGRSDADGNHRLDAYIVPASRPGPGARDLRQALADTLPEFAIPATFTGLPALPLTATGKLDRRRLPEPSSARRGLETRFLAARTPAEEALSDIWGEVLGLEEVGVGDSFLELGGDSLAAMRVIARVTDAFGVRPPLQELLAASTIEAMASLIVETQAASLQASELDDLLASLDSISEDEAAELLNEDQTNS